jgi:hypothetical protein
MLNRFSPPRGRGPQHASVSIPLDVTFDSSSVALDGDGFIRPAARAAPLQSSRRLLDNELMREDLLLLAQDSDAMLSHELTGCGGLCVSLSASFLMPFAPPIVFVFAIVTTFIKIVYNIFCCGASSGSGSVSSETVNSFASASALSAGNDGVGVGGSGAGATSNPTRSIAMAGVSAVPAAAGGRSSYAGGRSSSRQPLLTGDRYA